jgi:hypothetical protein
MWIKPCSVYGRSIIDLFSRISIQLLNNLHLKIVDIDRGSQKGSASGGMVNQAHRNPMQSDTVKDLNEYGA